MQDNLPFTPYFKYNKTKLRTFEPLFLNQDIIQVYDHFLQNILLQTPMRQIRHMHNPTSKLRCRSKNFSFGNIGRNHTVPIRNRFPQNHPVSLIQKDLDLPIIIFCSILNHFSLVGDPDTSQLLIFSHLLQNNKKTITFLKLNQQSQNTEQSYQSNYHQ